jgi:hypothetical protein
VLAQPTSRRFAEHAAGCFAKLPFRALDFLFRFLSRKNERKELLKRTILAYQKSNLTRAPKQEATNILEANLPSLDFFVSFFIKKK